MITLFTPFMYQKSIYDVNYDALKKLGVKCLLFDLDNTISPAKEVNFYSQTKTLFEKLKKDFLIVLFSNNYPNRVRKFGSYYGVEVACISLKPLTFKYRYLLKKYHLKRNEVATIGDQLVTDIQGGNKMHLKTILVEPMCDIDEKETWLNRKIEKVLFKKLKQKGILEKGKYYD